jgi:hypothetical protein
MIINVIRFTDHVLVGPQLEPRNSLTDRRTDPNTAYVFGQVELSRYDETFLRIDMFRSNIFTQSQLVPWAAVSSVLFTETPE